MVETKPANLLICELVCAAAVVLHSFKSILMMINIKNVNVFSKILEGGEHGIVSSLMDKPVELQYRSYILYIFSR